MDIQDLVVIKYKETIFIGSWFVCIKGMVVTFAHFTQLPWVRFSAFSFLVQDISSDTAKLVDSDNGSNPSS